MTRPVRRRMRHWKQRFDKNAGFIWNKPVTWQGKQVTIGDPIPESLSENKNRLRRFWEAKVIQLAEFEAPDVSTGQAPAPAVPDGDKTPDVTAESLVTKVKTRVWAVEGLEATFTTKGKAEAAAQEMLDAKAEEGDEGDEDGVAVPDPAHPVHPEENGEALVSITDEEIDAEFAEQNGEEEVDPAEGDKEPEDEDNDEPSEGEGDDFLDGEGKEDEGEGEDDAEDLGLDAATDEDDDDFLKD